MAEVCFDHSPDSVAQTFTQGGATITFSAKKGDFDVYFNNLKQFSPAATNPMNINPNYPKTLSLANGTNDCYIDFNWTCNICKTSRPARIIVGAVKYDNQLDRIENKLDNLMVEIKKIENNFNI